VVNTRTRTGLVLETIALRHQIAVLQCSGTRRPCLRGWDRLFWILRSWWWPNWRQSLLLVRPETVLRWRRNGWSALWRYRSRGRWRGGRPRVSREVRSLVTRMAGENFLWGAPRIQGELLMLGFKVSQATVSRYLSTLDRRPGPSWRTFLRNQMIALSHQDNPEHDYDAEDLGVWERFYGDRLTRPGARIASVAAAGWRSHSRPTLLPYTRRITMSPGWRARGALLRVQRWHSSPSRSPKARVNYFPTAVLMRGPPHHARALP
jgi:hypothetical protein